VPYSNLTRRRTVGNDERKLLVECIETAAWIESRGGPESVEAKRINIALNQVLNSLSDPSRDSSEPDEIIKVLDGCIASLTKS
jgi:hypothetical protein